MKVVRLEKENTKLKQKELRNKGLYFLLVYLSVTKIFKDTNRGNENLDDDGVESEEPFEDSDVQFSSSVCASYHSLGLSYHLRLTCRLHV
jgi:hypothetical protein